MKVLAGTNSINGMQGIGATSAYEMACTEMAHETWHDQTSRMANTQHVVSAVQTWPTERCINTLAPLDRLHKTSPRIDLSD